MLPVIIGHNVKNRNNIELLFKINDLMKMTRHGLVNLVLAIKASIFEAHNDN